MPTIMSKSSTRYSLYLGGFTEILLLQLLFILALGAAASNSSCPDPPLEASRRASAGWKGITEDECLARKFCWDGSCTACFQCYKPIEVRPVVDYTAGTTPRNLQATMIGVKSVHLQWDPPKDQYFSSMHDGRFLRLKGYTLRFMSYDHTHKFQVNTSSTELLMNSFHIHSAYFVEIFALYGDNKTSAVGYPAAWKTFTVQHGVPWPPIHFKVRRHDETVVIEWEKRPDNVENTNFELQYTCGEGEQKRMWIEGNIRDLVLKHLNDAEDCIFRMAGVNRYGVGPSGNPFYLLAKNPAQANVMDEGARQALWVAPVCVVIIILIVAVGLAVFFYRKWKKTHSHTRGGIHAYVDGSEYQGLNLSDVAQASISSPAEYTPMAIPIRILETSSKTSRLDHVANANPRQKRKQNEYVDSPVGMVSSIPVETADVYVNWAPHNDIANPHNSLLQSHSDRDTRPVGRGLVKMKYMAGELDSAPQGQALLSAAPRDAPCTVAPPSSSQHNLNDTPGDCYEDIAPVPSKQDGILYENITYQT